MKQAGFGKIQGKTFRSDLRSIVVKEQMDSRNQVLRTAGSYGRGIVLTNSEHLWFSA